MNSRLLWSLLCTLPVSSWKLLWRTFGFTFSALCISWEVDIATPATQFTTNTCVRLELQTCHCILKFYSKCSWTGKYHYSWETTNSRVKAMILQLFILWILLWTLPISRLDIGIFSKGTSSNSLIFTGHIHRSWCRWWQRGISWCLTCFHYFH